MAISGDGKRAGETHGETCPAVPPAEPKAGLGRYAEGSLLSGKYRLEALLGEGGMGAVWRASNVLLDLPVAIKLIRADLDRNALRARLQLEARSVAKLGHPAIVRIYDVGETEFGDPFIVMELLQGETLAQTLAQGRLSAVRAVQLLLPIIDACAVAHARGIVHRDLKPDNLLIALDDQRTQPKILDFGIAKLTDPRATDLRLTEIGTVVGSPEYMSPEQARGCDDVDYRTDIWSVCVVLYEAITGSAPFSAANYNALLRAIVEQEPTSIFDHAAGDAELWEILKRGLAKARDERHTSMAALGRALGHWLMGHGVHEDACGTSVESKWLARSSDPLMLGEVDPETLRPVSTGFDPKLTHDSRAGTNGIDSRGPFTATVRPAPNRRQRRLRAGVLACTLLAGLTTVFALVSKGLPSATPAHEAALAGRRDSAAPSATTAAPAFDPTMTTTVTIAQPVLDKKPEAAAPLSARARASGKPLAPGARVAPNARAASAARTVVAPSPMGSANAPAKSSHRDLDLISPYRTPSCDTWARVMSRANLVPPHRSALLAFTLGVALLAGEPQAFAEDSAPNAASAEQRKARAKSRYEQGVELYRNERYADAVVLFLEADALSPSAALSFNIARAYEKLADDAATLRWYRNYLRLNPEAPNGAEVRQSIQLLSLALAQKGLVQLTVLSTPTGATVAIDGRALGVTPLTIELKRGAHHALVTLRGFADAERDFTLSSSLALDLPFELKPVDPTAPALASAGPGATSVAAAPMPKARGRRFGVAPYVTLGVGALALGGAALFEALRRSAQDSARSDTIQLKKEDDLNTMNSRQTTARVLLGAGGVLVATGATLLVFNQPRAPESSARLSTLPGGAAFWFTRSF